MNSLIRKRLAKPCPSGKVKSTKGYCIKKKQIASGYEINQATGRKRKKCTHGKIRSPKGYCVKSRRTPSPRRSSSRINRLRKSIQDKITKQKDEIKKAKKWFTDVDKYTAEIDPEDELEMVVRIKEEKEDLLKHMEKNLSYLEHASLDSNEDYIVVDFS